MLRPVHAKQTQVDSAVIYDIKHCYLCFVFIIPKRKLRHPHKIGKWNQVLHVFKPSKLWQTPQFICNEARNSGKIIETSIIGKKRHWQTYKTTLGYLHHNGKWEERLLLFTELMLDLPLLLLWRIPTMHCRTLNATVITIFALPSFSDTAIITVYKLPTPVMLLAFSFIHLYDHSSLYYSRERVRSAVTLSKLTSLFYVCRKKISI